MQNDLHWREHPLSNNIVEVYIFVGSVDLKMGEKYSMFTDNGRCF